MGEAPILNYYKPHPPPIGWRSEIAGAFAGGTVLGCMAAGLIAASIDAMFFRGHFNACNAMGGSALAGVIVGVFGGIVLVIAMAIRARILRGQFQLRRRRVATWAGVLYPAPMVVFMLMAGLADRRLSAETGLAIALALLVGYPIGAAWMLVRPWGEPTACDHSFWT